MGLGVDGGNWEAVIQHSECDPNNDLKYARIPYLVCCLYAVNHLGGIGINISFHNYEERYSGILDIGFDSWPSCDILHVLLVSDTTLPQRSITSLWAIVLVLGCQIDFSDKPKAAELSQKHATI